MSRWLTECRRLLVRAPNWLGNVVMSLPALEAVKRAAPHVRLTLALPEHMTELLREADDVDEVLPVRPETRFVAESGRLFRARGFDSALLLPNSFGAALAVWLAGIPRRAGYRRDARSWMLTEAVACDARRRALHQAQYFLALVQDLGAPLDFDRTYRARLSAPPAARAQVAATLSAERKRPGAPLFILAPCAVGSGREWPAECFGRLAAILWEEGAEVVLTASPTEYEKCAQVARLARLSGGEVINLAGRNSVAQMAALVEAADGFAGNDSGPMHLAGTMGLAAVGVFVGTDPLLSSPLGPRVAVLGGPGAVPRPQDVAARLLEMVLRRSSHARRAPEDHENGQDCGT